MERHEVLQGGAKVTTSTRTTQPVSRASVENAAKKDTTEAEEKNRDVLAVCDSLHKLHLTLHRLSYAVKRKKIEESLTGKYLPDVGPIDSNMRMVQKLRRQENAKKI